MGLSCKIVRNNKGELTQVLNTNGQPSRLFFEAYQITKDPEKALNLWAVHDTPEYQDKFGEASDIDSIDVNNLVSVFSDITAYGKGLTPSELFDVKSTMRRTGVTTLSEMHSKLRDIFFEGEAISFNPQKAVSSGIYSVQDIVDLDISQAVEMVLKLEASLLKGDAFVESEKEVHYFNPNIKTALGSSMLVPQSELEQEWVDSITNFQDEAEVKAKLESLPYKEFIASVQAGYDTFKERISQLKRIVVATVSGGELSSTNTGTYETVKNTIKNNIPAQKIRNEIVYLQNILPTVWDRKKDAVKGVLREIEEELAEYGVDIIGLANLRKSKEEIIDFLETVYEMSTRPNNENIRNFSDKYDELFGVKPQTEVIRLDNNLRDYTIVKLFTEKSDQEMFENFGLIRVGINLYHKVKNSETLEELYDALYEKVLAGETNITLQSKDKEQAIKELQAITSSKDLGLDFKNERVAIYQILFNHPPIKNTVQEEVEFLGGIVTDEDYLKTNFVVDLYDYILEEKLKGTPLYRGVLSKIKFNDQDIVVEGALEDFQNIEYYQQLIDYLRLRKKISAKSLVPQQLKTITPDSIIAVNNPKSVPIYEGYSIKRGNLLAVPTTNQVHIRIGNEVYQSLTSNENTSVFVKLKPNTNPLYYTTKVQTEEYSPEQLKKSLAENLTQEVNIEQQKEQAGMKKPFFQNLKDKAVNFSVSAWHGSPYSFDRFTTEKMGTGEGNQAFGWGLYFTDLESIARDYAKKLAFKKSSSIFDEEGLTDSTSETILKDEFGEDTIKEYLKLDRKEGVFSIPIREKGYDEAYLQVTNNGWDFVGVTFFEEENEDGDIDTTSEEYRRSATASDFMKHLVRVEYSDELLSEFVNLKRGTGNKNLYKVSLHQGKTPDQYTWLEWDKKMPKELEDKLTKAIQESQELTSSEKETLTPLSSFDSGMGLYDSMAMYLGGQKEASLFLLENGIDGIKYPAESISRGATSDTARGFNYVVFDENAVTIEEQIQFQVGEAQRALDQNFQQNLVEFISRKGVKVVTDMQTVQAKLKELGFESINAMMTFNEIQKLDKWYIRRSENGMMLEVLYEEDSKIYDQKTAVGVAEKIKQYARQKLREKYPDATLELGTVLVKRIDNKLFLDEKILLDIEQQQIEADVVKDFYEMVEEEMQRIEEEEMQKDFKENRRFEIRRGASPRWLINEMNFLKTPQGTVLGFEHKGVIYLDNTMLNTVTTLHELTHVFQSVVDIKASKGDLKATQIKNKRAELFQPEVDFWKEYHKGKVGVGQGQQQFIGEQNNLILNMKTIQEIEDEVLIEMLVTKGVIKEIEC